MQADTRNVNTSDVSVLIVNWNARDMLQNCLDSLQGIPETKVEVIVVDNASTDDSITLLRSYLPAIRLITNDTNLGFAAANNQAAGLANGRYLLLLNPDTEVCPGAIECMINFADAHRNLAAIGPKLLNPDGTIQRSCWRGYPGIATALIDAFYLWKAPGLPIVRNTELSADKLHDTLEVDHILGACMLIPHEVWNEIGPLDESYFLFLEETEWCRRANGTGRRIVYLPHAEVVHFGQHSMRQQPSRNLPHLYRSYCHFYRRSSRGNRVRMIVLKTIIAFAILIRLVMWRLRVLLFSPGEQRKKARDMLAGYLQVLRELPSM